MEPELKNREKDQRIESQGSFSDFSEILKSEDMQMNAIIDCRTVANGRLGFYLSCRDWSYYLFSQAYDPSVYSYFGNGVSIDRSIDASRCKRNHAVLQAMRKLPAHIRYIEKEYGIVVLRQTARKLAESARRAS